jgi:hypothetical protein
MKVDGVKETPEEQIGIFVTFLLGQILFQNASGLGEIVNLYLDMAVERRNIAKPL